jgi:hypothetical protein
MRGGNGSPPDRLGYTDTEHGIEVRQRILGRTPQDKPLLQH